MEKYVIYKLNITKKHTYKQTQTGRKYFNVQIQNKEIIFCAFLFLWSECISKSEMIEKYMYI